MVRINIEKKFGSIDKKGTILKLELSRKDNMHASQITKMAKKLAFKGNFNFKNSF
jgi:hypothetical protein